MKQTDKHSYRLIAVLLSILVYGAAFSQTELDACNITWTSQSRNSGESMPCGGGDIGLNVWVENGGPAFLHSPQRNLR